MKTDDILQKIQSITQQNTSMLQTKNERQLYIGNLPPGILLQILFICLYIYAGITVTQLIDLLNTAIVTLKASNEETGPVINAWISSDGKPHFYYYLF